MPMHPRKRYSIGKKKQILQEIDALAEEKGRSAARKLVATKYGLHRSLLPRWESSVSLLNLNMKQSHMKSVRYVKAYSEDLGANSDFEKELFRLFLERRAKGSKTFRRWFYVKLVEIGRENGVRLKPTEGWFSGFKRRFKLTRRRETNVKSLSVQERLPVFRRWYLDLRAFPRSSGPGKYGIYPPDCRLNMDQVGLNLGQFSENVGPSSVAQMLGEANWQDAWSLLVKINNTVTHD